MPVNKMLQMISWPLRVPDEKLLSTNSASDRPKLKNIHSLNKAGGPNSHSKLDRSLEIAAPLVTGCSSGNEIMWEESESV